MFNLKLLLLLPLILITLPTTVFGQWSQTGGPEGGYVAEIVQSGNTLVASGGNGGIYRSFDFGDSWENDTAGLPINASVQSLVEYNSALYVSIYQGGIYKSIDEGANWVAANTGIEYTTSYKILVDGNTIYAGNANGGVYYSPDDGASWAVKSNGIENVQIQEFVAFNGKVYAAGFGLYETFDNGDTWTQIDIPGVGPNGVRSMTVKDGIFYAAGDGNVYISADNLETWSTTNLNIAASIFKMGGYDDFVYLTTSFGRYYTSTDNGVNWSLSQNTETDSFPYDMFFSPTKILMSTSEGIFESFDNGATWVKNNTGIKALRIWALAFDGAHLFAGTEAQGVFRSADEGQTWAEINNGIDALNGRTIYDILTVGTTTFLATGGGLYTSADNGDNWIHKFDPGTNKSTQALAYEENLFITAVNGSGVFTSSDMGETWTLTSTDGLNTNTSYSSILLQGSTIVVGTHDAEIFISEDLGATWSDITIPDGFYFVQDLELRDGKLFAATAQGLWTSDDLGNTWGKYVQNDWDSIQDIVVGDGIVYAATGSGIKVSAENRFQWYPVNEGLGNPYVNELLIKDGQLFAGTDANSVWSRPLEEIVLEPADIDNDGVINELDYCPNTEPGRIVDQRGCDKIAPDAFTIYTESPTCPDVANGTIEISTELEGYSFTIDFEGEGTNESLTEQTLTENVVFDELMPGNYKVTINIPAIFYGRTFGVTVMEAEDVSAGKKVLDLSNKTVSYVVSGSKEYTVRINDKTEIFTFSTASENEIKLFNLQASNTIVISGKSDCQGKVTDSFTIDDGVSLYPTITRDNLFIEGTYEGISVKIFDTLGQLVNERQFEAGDEKTINLGSCTAGLYFVHINSGEKITTYKIIKQ